MFAKARGWRHTSLSRRLRGRGQWKAMPLPRVGSPLRSSVTLACSNSRVHLKAPAQVSGRFPPAWLVGCFNPSHRSDRVSRDRPGSSLNRSYRSYSVTRQHQEWAARRPVSTRLLARPERLAQSAKRGIGFRTLHVPRKTADFGKERNRRHVADSSLALRVVSTVPN